MNVTFPFRRANLRAAAFLAAIGVFVLALTASAQIGLASPAGPAPLNTPVSPPLLAQWSFEGNLDDRSGNGYHLGEVGAGTYYAPGCQGQALHFNNDASNYLSRPGDDPAFDFGAADYSIVLWVNFDQLPNHSHEQTLIEKCSGDGCSVDGWGLTVMNYNAIRFIQNNGSHNYLDSPGIGFRTGGWLHIAAVRQGSASYLYVDGAEVANGTAWDLTDTTAPLIIGRRFDNGQQLPLAGFLDEVSLYSGALSASDVQFLYQSGAVCQAQPAPLHIFVYDDYEESGYGNSLREYLEGRGHTVTYSNDNVGLIDVWPRYSNYDVILAIHTTGGGTLTDLQTWFQNGRGYIAMLGGNMWAEAEDSYIRSLLGATNNTGDVGSGWQPDQLFWADPTHPITSTPNAGWDVFRLPWGQNQYYIDILGGHTVVAAPAGAVLQTREGVEGAARLAVFGSNYHDQDRADPEARRLVENLLFWAADLRPSAWFAPDESSQKTSPGNTVTHQFELVNRAGYDTSYNLSLAGNAWVTEITDQNGVPISVTSVIPNHEHFIVKVNVTIPPGAATDEFDEFTLAAEDSTNPAIVANAEGRTNAPGPAYRVNATASAAQVGFGGATALWTTVTDRDGVWVVDGTPVTFTVTAGGTVFPVVATTLGGSANSIFTGTLSCALAEIQAVSGEGWDAVYVSVSDSGPTEMWGGNIVSDTTWTTCNSPYVIHDSVTVSPGVTLTLEAGAQVRFDEDAQLFVLGSLLADGQPTAHVLFTGNNTNSWPGYWPGLVIGDADNAASAWLDYASLSFAGRWQEYPYNANRAGVLLWHGAAQIANSRFYHNHGYALWTEPSTIAQVTGSFIYDNENGLALRSAEIAVADDLLPSTDYGGRLWRYTAFSAPPAGWNTDPGFDDSAWGVGPTAFCDGGGCPTFLELEGATMYARTFVTPTFPAGAIYYLRAARDDSVNVWVNGVQVIADNQGGGAQWTQFITITLNPGPNLIAAEMSDGGAGGNYFDLELLGGALQQPLIAHNQFTRNGQGIYIERSAPLVENNEIWENNSEGIGANYGASALIRNNVIHHNQRSGIAIGSGFSGWSRVYNNTLDSNGNYGILWANWWTDQPDIQNNLATNNTNGGIGCRDTRYMVRAYNDAWNNGWDFEGCSNPDGPGNFSADPIYLNPEAGDYHLQLGSPAIDAGNPDAAFNDVDASRNDLGAYGGPAGESYTYIDARGPMLDWANAQPPVTNPGGGIVLQAYLWDPSGVAWATAEIESPDETVIASLTLYDDGAHNDGAPGDSVYGNAWNTPPGEASYWVDISSADSAARLAQYNNAASFRTHTPVLWVVTTTADSGAGSLRQALLDADYGDTITFDPGVFPPAAPATIGLASALPDLSTGGVTVDAADVGVILDGSGLTGGAVGLSISGDNNVILGLQILDFPAYGVWLHDGASGNRIGGNPATGSGPTGEGNTIANNRWSGVRIEGLGSDGNILTGNFIGPDLDGARLAYPVDMAISPDYDSDCTLYVATQNDGVSKSTDCGTSWFTANNGLTEARLLQVKIPPDATNANTVFVLAENGYLFQTTDGGANWMLISTQPEQFDRRNLALSAEFSSDRTMYAAAKDWAWQQMGDQPGVFKSSDGGVTWARQSAGMSNTQIWKVVASPDAAVKGVLFALGQNSTIQKSIDGAASWFDLPYPGGGVNDLAVSPDYSVDQTVFVAGNDGRIYRSTDGGWTWQWFNTQRGDPRFLALSPDFSSDHTLCHGGGWNDWAYCSSDNGETWIAHDTQLAGHLADAGTGMAFSPAYSSDHTVFALSFVGMSRSTDGGSSWQVLRSLNELSNWEGVWIGNLSNGNTIGPDNVIGNNFNGVVVNNDSSNNLITGNHIGVNAAGTAVIPNPGDGVNISGPNNQILENLIGGSMTDGVRIAGEQAVGNVVANNFIGVNAAGVVLRNEGAGVSIHSGAHDNLIGGDTPDERNIISGNGYGIGIWNWNTYANTVSGNYIGTDPAGLNAIGNGDGIQIHDWAHDNLLGGDTPAERNLISGNWQGIRINNNAHDNVVSGNYIGVDVTGSAALPNQGTGVSLNNNAYNNRIGGATPGERNVISGNQDQGVGLWDTGTSYNLIQGNYIGLDASGSFAIANFNHGVHMNRADYNQVRDNIIGGNRGHGVELCCDNQTAFNVIAGNFIGLNASGDAAIPNQGDGVRFANGVHDNTVGGANPGDRNVISGNDGSGVSIMDFGTNNNIVQGNWIGLDASGTQPLPNGVATATATAIRDEAKLQARESLHTVDFPEGLVTPILNTLLEQFPENPLLQFPNPAAVEQPERSNNEAGVFIAWGASDNTIGPDNLIAFNGKEGVYLEGGDTLRNTITQNSLFYNQSTGILLRDGANNNLDTPHIDSVDLPGGLVSGTACPNCAIEVFSASDEEGKIFEGSTVADGTGYWSLVTGHSLAGPNVTATATDADGNTSPFSQLFDLLVFDLNVPQGLWALDNLGLRYTLVNSDTFATVNLADYDVFFVGFTGNDPQPDDLLQSLLNRRADIAAFVQNGGALVANSEDGVVATPLDWLWVPVTVTHQNSGGDQMFFASPDHRLLEGLSEADLYGWSPYHNVFTAWDWPEAEVVLRDNGYGQAIVLAGAYGGGRMVLSGSDPDYHGEKGAVTLLRNELFWAAGVLADDPPQVTSAKPWAGSATADRAVITFGFSQAVDAATVNDASVSVTGSASGAVNGEVRFYAELAQGDFIPDAPFSVGERVTVTLSTAIQDLNGNGLDGDGDHTAEGSPQDDYTWSFTVRAGETIVVDSTGDEGDRTLQGVTLRQALQWAQPGDTITFDPAVFPPAAPETIFVENGDLPCIWTGYVTLDATAAGVIVDGSRGADWGPGLCSDGNLIQGLRIQYFSQTGIYIGGGYNQIGGDTPVECNILSGNGRGVYISNLEGRQNIIQGNFIGVDESGAASFPNQWEGVRLDYLANHNLIGGGLPGEGNLISANNGDGVYLEGASFNIIVGNLIGVDVSGMAALGNGGAGVQIAYGSHNNTVGGATSGERNVISANGWHGIHLQYTQDNRILGNYLGVDITGNSPLGNGAHGLSARWGGFRNVVGGSDPGEGNVAAGNVWYGIRFWDSYQGAIIGNIVGLGADGVTPLGNDVLGVGVFYSKDVLVEGNTIGNSQYGVWLIESYNLQVRANRIGVDTVGGAAPNLYNGLWISSGNSQWNTIGGPDPADGNIIAHSGGNGVEIWNDGGDTFAISLSHNAIFANAGLGIDLLNGANHNVIAPVVVSANPGAGTASGTACAFCTVEIFSDNDDEGQWFEGSTTADGAGNWTLDTAPFTGSNVHATATDGEGNTSEFSGPPPTVSAAAPNEATPGTLDLGVTLSGADFRDNWPLSVDFGAGIAVSAVEFHHSGEIKAYINVDGGAAYGPRDIIVTNYDGQSGVLPGGFNVVSVPPPPPTVTAVIPAEIVPGVTAEIQILGAGFIDRPSVYFTETGVTVNWVVFNEPEKLSVGITVDAGAPLGSRTVVVTNPDGQSSSLADALTLIAPLFEEVASTAGVANIGDGLGVAWGDYDADGYPDLYTARGADNGGEPDILYHNLQNGAFEDASAATGTGDAGAGFGAVWGDYDNDGDLDLFVSRYWQSNLLYANNGDTTFSEVGAAAGVDNVSDSAGAAWADFDRDGWLDLFVIGEYEANVLYHNNGDGTFTDVTGAAGIPHDGGQEESAAWGDYDDDGYPDLYLTNANGPNRLYHNQGNGAFSDVSAASGANDTRFSHSAAWGDYDNDGDLDLFVANYGQSGLFRNNGDGTFNDVAEDEGIYVNYNSLGVTFGDYDNNGWLDIFIAGDNGKQLYLNQGDVYWQHYEPELFRPGNSYSAATADYDNDGDLDVYVANRWDGNPNLLYRNVGNDNHWLRVNLLGVLSNASGIGARVRVVSGGLSMNRAVSGGSGFASQDSLPVEFGLGALSGAVTVEVYWPSGVVDVHTGVAVDQAITFVESTPYLHDLAVAAASPAGEFPVDTPLTPAVVLRNFGQFSESGVPVVCTIEHNASVVYNETTYTSNIAPAAWATLVFPSFTPSEAGDYTLLCQSYLPGDERPANDQQTRLIVVAEQVADAWTKDDPDDDGDVPSSWDEWYGSPDLWVRNDPDGGLIHQDPIEGITNTVYVRLRNRGNTPVYTGTVSVYWIEPSLGVRCGGWAPIGEIFFENLLPGEERILSLPWTPTRTGHTCMQDVIDAPQDPYNRGLECSPQWVPWDNNVEWHNINILANPDLGEGVMDIKEAQLHLVNIYDRSKDVDLIVDRLTFPLTGTITVQLPEAIFDRWYGYGGSWGEGVEVDTQAKEIRVSGAVSATIGAIPMLADEDVLVGLRFEGPAGLEFELAFRERIEGLMTGGVAYQWAIPDTTPPQVIGVSPAAGASGVDLTAPVVVTFSEPVSPLSLEFSASPDPGGWQFTWSAAGDVLTATHTAFVEGTSYNLSVSASDASANAMTAPFTWSFTARSDILHIFLPIILRSLPLFGK